jgi:hypothetical protein
MRGALSFTLTSFLSVEGGEGTCAAAFNNFQKPYFSTAAMAASKAGLSFARVLTSR